MSHTIQLHLPDDVYATLQRQAEQEGKTVEDFVAEHLSAGTQSVADDPLLQLAGALDSDLGDIAERHDDYIGQRLSKGLKPSAGS